MMIDGFGARTRGEAIRRAKEALRCGQPGDLLYDSLTQFLDSLTKLSDEEYDRYKCGCGADAEEAVR